MTRSPQLVGRERMALIREAVVGVVNDAAPRALCTSEVQATFAPGDYARVASALRQVARQGRLVSIPEADRHWWLAGTDVCGARCAWCGEPARRLRTGMFTHAASPERWRYLAWLSCSPCTERRGRPDSDDAVWVPDLRPAYDGPRIDT